MKEGTAPLTQVTQSGAPPPPRAPAFKPNETFLECRHKPFPWFTVGSTSVSAEDKEAISDYLNSGGDFKDVATPVIYIKRLFDHETLKVFMPSLTEAIGQNKPHCTCTIVECICDVVMSRVPLRARWTKVLNRIKTNNAM